MTGLFSICLLVAIVCLGDSIRTGSINQWEIIAYVLIILVSCYILKEFSNTCLTYVLSKEGCEIYDLKGYHKTFLWEECQSKYIIHAKDGDSKGMVKGVAVLSPRNIGEKSIWYNPLEYSNVYHIKGIKDFIYELYCPRDIVYIWLRATPQKCNEDGSWFYWNVDERTFRQKMAEWHVDLDEEKEEIPPWKEFL